MQDATQLVRILRTSKSLDEITEAARELAQSDNQADRQELYRMAQGNHRKWLSWYSVDMILISIEALAGTATEEDRRFLEDLLKWDEHRTGWSGEAGRMYFDNRRELQDTYHVTYPNAPKKLRQFLDYDRDSIEDTHQPNAVEQRIRTVKAKLRDAER